MKIIVVTKNGTSSRYPAEQKADGSLWYGRNPFLSFSQCSNADELKIKYIAAIKARKFSLIAPEHFAKIGQNGNTLIEWAEEYDKRMAPILKAQYEAKKEKEEKTIKIYISSRGWGEFSPVEWIGDASTPTYVIIAEARKLMADSNDVDSINQSDDELSATIEKAKASHNLKKAEATAKAKEITDAIETAKATGKAVVISTWTTTSCHNGNDDECSCDIATKYANPDGTITTKYSCCY